MKSNNDELEEDNTAIQISKYQSGVIGREVADQFREQKDPLARIKNRAKKVFRRFSRKQENQIGDGIFRNEKTELLLKRNSSSESEKNLRLLVELVKHEFNDLKEEELSIKELERKYPEKNLNEQGLDSSLDKQTKDKKLVFWLNLAVLTKSTDFINDLFNYSSFEDIDPKIIAPKALNKLITKANRLIVKKSTKKGKSIPKFVKRLFLERKKGSTVKDGLLDINEEKNPLLNKQTLEIAIGVPINNSINDIESGLYSALTGFDGCELPYRSVTKEAIQDAKEAPKEELPKNGFTLEEPSTSSQNAYEESLEKLVFPDVPKNKLPKQESKKQEEKPRGNKRERKRVLGS